MILTTLKQCGDPGVHCGDPECDGGHAFLAMLDDDERREAMPRSARSIAEIAEYGALIPDGAPDIPGRLPYDDGTVPAGVAVAADRAGRGGVGVMTNGAAQAEDAWEYAKWGGPKEDRYTIVWLVGSKHAHLRRAATVEEARGLLDKYRAVNPGAQYRILHTVTTTTEEWVE